MRDIHRFCAAGALLAAVAVLSACSSTKRAKPAPPPPLCLQIDASEAIVTYGAEDAKGKTVGDFAKRLERYVNQQLQESGIPLSKSTACNPAVDTILRLRIDTLKATYAGTFTTLTRFRAVDLLVSYQFIMTAPGEARPRLDFDDERQDADADKLARKVASYVAGWAEGPYF